MSGGRQQRDDRLAGPNPLAWVEERILDEGIGRCHACEVAQAHPRLNQVGFRLFNPLERRLAFARSSSEITGGFLGR